MEQIIKNITRKERLSEFEIEDRKSEVIDRLKRLDELTAEKKRVANQYKNKLAEVNQQLQDLRMAIEFEEEDRTYVCKEVKNSEDKTWDWVDVDSGEVIKTRPFAAIDYQTAIEA